MSAPADGDVQSEPDANANSASVQHDDVLGATSAAQECPPRLNRVQVVYNSNHSPYLYGALHVIDGNPEGQFWHRPFAISKRDSDGNEIVYGTVTRLLDRIIGQFQRLTAFQESADRKLRDAGIAVDGLTPELPDSPITDAVIDEQERLFEDVLLTTSIYVRILHEIFHKRLRFLKVAVFDYDDQWVADADLDAIGNLVVHNRFISIRGRYVVDLISDRKFMSDAPQMGLKFDFGDYLQRVADAVSCLTVKDLVTELWSRIERLSASSDLGDIVFVVQNLYTLGGLVTGNQPPVDSGPIKMILDRVLREEIDGLREGEDLGSGTEVAFRAEFRSPRFRLEPDLDDKRIRTDMTVNGESRRLTLGYERFFESVLEAAGDTRLRGETTVNLN